MPVKVMAGEAPWLEHTRPVAFAPGAVLHAPATPLPVPVIGMWTVAGPVTWDKVSVSLLVPVIVTGGALSALPLAINESAEGEPVTLVTHRPAAPLQPGANVTPP